MAQSDVRRVVSEYHWASGLFEGEGCISVLRNGLRRYPYPRLSLSMNDEDVVRRFHAAVGTGHVTQNGKKMWVWQASSLESTQAVVGLLWQGLGQRRRARAKEVFSEVRGTQYPGPGWWRKNG